MNNIDALRISEQRDDISEWAVARFRELMEEDRIDDAIAFADELYGFLSVELLTKAVTAVVAPLLPLIAPQFAVFDPNALPVFPSRVHFCTSAETYFNVFACIVLTAFFFAEAV